MIIYHRHLMRSGDKKAGFPSQENRLLASVRWA